METITLKKKTSEAFGKKIFYLGETEHGENLWLEEAKWDCQWYWGFGYVETYTNNKYPHLAKDISSHSHFDGLVGFKKDNGDYVHHLNESPKMKSTVLGEKESWELCDLMKSFYTLRDTAELYHQGNSHLTSSHELCLKNKEAYDRINKVELPKIFKRVYEILTPKD